MYRLRQFYQTTVCKDRWPINGSSCFKFCIYNTFTLGARIYIESYHKLCIILDWFLYCHRNCNLRRVKCLHLYLYSRHIGFLQEQSRRLEKVQDELTLVTSKVAELQKELNAAIEERNVRSL